MKTEAVEQYAKALKAGQRYYRSAMSRGEYPYPPALDAILDPGKVAGYASLGVMDIPTELIVGTKTVGRVSALAGNFMPLLEPGSEFAGKWVHLCDSQFTEGIRDPIKCYEYLGRFYVEEGNKRVSVLSSLGATSVSGSVTRVIPRYSEEPEIRTYYEFMRFHGKSGFYGLQFSRPEDYSRIQAALGFEEDHVWTEDERRRFASGFAKFRGVFEKLDQHLSGVSPAEALLVWLQVFPFSELRELTPQELERKLWAIWPDISVHGTSDPIEIKTEPEATEEKGLLGKLLTLGRGEHLKAAFIYAFDPEQSTWSGDHDRARAYLEDRMGKRLSVKTYVAENHDYFKAMETAAAEGASLIFATTPAMVSACRRMAALHGELRILICALSMPYTGIRTYYCRNYEASFVTGAIAGAMAESDAVGYVANYPILGVPAEINAFALGLRMTNPRARVKLAWSCLPGDPMEKFSHAGVTVVCNRVNPLPEGRIAYEQGVWQLRDGDAIPLALPQWEWGKLYEQITAGILAGTWEEAAGSRAVNYWWGMDSGAVDVLLSNSLPVGVRALASLLKEDIAAGVLVPFRTELTDQSGQRRGDGTQNLKSEEIIHMDWLCGNVDGILPGFDQLLPASKETVRMLGLHREELPPEKEEKQI